MVSAVCECLQWLVKIINFQQHSRITTEWLRLSQNGYGLFLLLLLLLHLWCLWLVVVVVCGCVWLCVVVCGFVLLCVGRVLSWFIRVLLFCCGVFVLSCSDGHGHEEEMEAIHIQNPSYRNPLARKRRPLALHLHSESVVSITGCCSHSENMFLESARSGERPPHSQHIWSCCMKKRILYVGGVIVARPVDSDCHGKLPCSVGRLHQQTNKFNTKDHLVRTGRNNVIPEVSDRDR